jgi:hypothetical protein
MEVVALADLRLPLPLFATLPLGSAVSRDGGTFTVLAGLDQSLVSQLKKYSLDESDTELQENTSDRMRFGEGSYEEWYGRKRVPFALVNAKTGTLAAIAWFGPKPLAQPSMKYLSDEERKKAEAEDSGMWHTISYRCYGPYRGKGLMRGFVQFAMDEYLKALPGAKLWAIINTKNQASDALAEKLGFKPLPEASHPEENLLVMVRE